MSLRNISVESIDFQMSSSFGKELESVFQSLIDENISEDEYQTSHHKKNIEAIVFKQTGLKIALRLKTDYDCVFLPTLNKNHIFYNDLYKDLFDKQDNSKIFEKIKNIKDKHTVNLKTAKVTGIFSELVNELHVDFFAANKIMKYTAGQITAILLHEVGHLFTYFEYITRQHTTNQVLSTVLKSVINKDSIKEKEFVFEQAGNILGNKKDLLTELVNQDDTRVITSVIFKKTIEIAKSELGTESYDYSACEQLADQFVTRFGYGRELIEGLDIDHTKYWNSPEKSIQAQRQAAWAQISTTVIFLTFATLSGIAAAFVAFGFFSFLSVLSFITSSMGAGAGSKDYTYDILKTRYLRVREQFIQRLKDKKIDKDEVKLILSSLEQIDAIIKNTHEFRGPLDKMCDYIFSKDKSARASVELQRDLESLAMNDFFIKSKELSLA